MTQILQNQTKFEDDFLEMPRTKCRAESFVSPVCHSFVDTGTRILNVTVVIGSVVDDDDGRTKRKDITLLKEQRAAALRYLVSIGRDSRDQRTIEA